MFFVVSKLAIRSFASVACLRGSCRASRFLFWLEFGLLDINRVFAAGGFVTTNMEHPAQAALHFWSLKVFV